MLPASRVIGTRRAAESIAMLWPWFARITQSEGFSDEGSGGVVREGSGFIEKRCLALSVTAVRISSNVGFSCFKRCHFNYKFVSVYRRWRLELRGT